MRALAIALLLGIAGCNQVLGVDKFTSIDASASAIDSPIVDGRVVDGPVIDAHVDAILPDAKQVCGDDMVESPEDCDTGGVDTSTCDSDCTFPMCGDGHTNTQYTNPANGKPEQCDGGGVDTTTCNKDCTTAMCGDGYTNTTAGETCDTSGDSATCDADCTTPSCGDGHTNMSYVVPGTGKTEQCDKGAANSDAVGATCDTKCQIPGCGNGVKEGNEGCDDANATNTDDCTNSCKLAVCGDGIVHSTTTGTTGADGVEQCDGGAADTATCNGDTGAAVADGVACKGATCGDGYVNSAAGEQCDAGPNDSASCNGPAGGSSVACRIRRCGDGYTNAAGGETCDDANTVSGDGCSSTCSIESGWTCSGRPSVCQKCGDGIVEGTEQCDGSVLRGATCVSLGFTSGTLACHSNCTYDESACN